MIRFSSLIFLILLPLFCFGASDWQKAINAVEDKIVLIEFYEQRGSIETMEEKSRIKYYLSGVIVDDAGLILTSSSIFKPSLEFSGFSSLHFKSNKPSEIKVRTKDGKYHPAEFVGKDDDRGIGFIRLTEKPKLPFLKFKENKNLGLGANLLIIQRLGELFDHQLIISERRINAVLTKPRTFYLCENNLTAGSRFGLVMDKTLNVVGIITGENAPHSFMSGGSDSSSEPLEIMPYDQFKKLIASPPVFKQKESTRKKWLGVYMQPFTRAMAKYFGNDSIKGVLINTVIHDSPAEKAGIKSGDVATAIDDVKLTAETINDLDIFRDLIRSKQDSLARFQIYRDSVSAVYDVVLDNTPISQFLADEVANPILGFSVKEITQDIIISKQLDFDTDGVWVSRVDRAGWADVAGLYIGDLIISVNDKTIDQLETIKEVFSDVEKNQPNYIQLFIKRNGGTGFLYIKTNFIIENE